MPHTAQRARLQWRYMLLAFVASLAIMGLKFWAYALTNSAAILSDALEGIVNVAAAGYGLYAVHLSAQPQDEDHPYGHGKVEFLSAGFEGGLILMAGLGILYQGFDTLRGAHHPIAELGWGIVYTTTALVANLLLGLLLLRAGTRLQSIPLQADGKHLVVDSWSSAGLLAGLLLMYYTGWYWVDGLLALLMGAFVMMEGAGLVRKALAGLMDQRDEALLARIASILEQQRRAVWIDVHNLRTQQYGAALHIDCHLTLPWYMPLQDVHDEMKALETLLQRELATPAELFIHTDPCLPSCCAICGVINCAERQAQHTQRIAWTAANIQRNQKHSLTATQP